MAGRFTVEGVFRVVDRMSRPINRIGGRFDRFTRNIDQGFTGLGRMAEQFRAGFVAIGAAIAGAAAIAVHGLRGVIEAGLEFDRVMARAGAKFHVRRGSAEFEQLERAALHAAQTTQFSANEAAAALEQLGASGSEVADAIAALPYVLNTAAAADMDLGQASDVLTDEMSAFGLVTQNSAENARNLARVADVMAHGANASSQSFEELTGALGNFAAGAHSAGVSIETATALISALADQGEKGDRAGTRLNQMLANLRAPTAKAAREIRHLHINLRNADHSLKNPIELVAEFERALGGMNAEARDRSLANIFSEQGLRPMQLLLQTGSTRLEELQTQMLNSGGAAEEMAAMMRDSAGGDVQSFGAQIEALKLELWSAIRGPFRQIVQAITEWVSANREWIASGFQAAVSWLIDNMPTIVAIVTRIGIVVGVIAAIIIGAFLAVFGTLTAVSLAIWSIITLVIEGVVWIVEKAGDLASSIAEALSGIWQSIQEYITPIVEFVVGLFVILRAKVAEMLAPVFAQISRAANWVREKWAPIGAFFGELWSSVSAVFAAAWSVIMGEGASIYSSFVALWEPLATVFTMLWQSISDSFMNTVGPIVDIVSAMVDQVRSVGRQEMAQNGGAEGTAGAPQVVTPQERTAAAVSETSSTEHAVVTIHDQTNRAEVTQRPRRNARTRIRLQPSGAM